MKILHLFINYRIINIVLNIGGIEQPGVTSVIGLFRRESEPPSVSSSPQSSVLLIEEATSLLSPHSKTNGRRGSMLELASSVDPIPEEELMTGTKKGKILIDVFYLACYFNLNTVKGEIDNSYFI